MFDYHLPVRSSVQKLMHLRIDRIFCSVHKEITSIRLYTPCTQVTQGCVESDWGYFEWTEQIISINPYKSIQTFCCYDIEKYINFFKIRQIIKENHLMITTRDALRTTSTFRFSTLTNNLNFLNQSKHV